MESPLRVLMIAGPNGAGKTTFAWVRHRVNLGGHDIAESVIRRRFKTGLSNLKNLYAPVVDSWALYDNSGLEPVLLEWSEN
jgi:predicted ABC-type ATPase